MHGPRGVARNGPKGGGRFEGANVLRILAQLSFHYNFATNYKKIWANEGGSDPYGPPLGYAPGTRGIS